MKRDRCGGPHGKEIFPSRAEAREYLPEFRARHGGAGKAYWCVWGNHYHVTKGTLGRKGKRGGRGRQ